MEFLILVIIRVSTKEKRYQTEDVSSPRSRVTVWLQQRDQHAVLECVDEPKVGLPVIRE